MNNNLVYKIALSRIPKVGSVLAKNLIGHCGSVESVFSASKKALIKIPGIGEIITKSILDAHPEKLAGRELDFLKSNPQIKPLFFTDDEYPQRLKHFDGSPILLYTEGSADFNAHRTVAVVGTRKATEYGKILCEKVVEELQAYGVQIISGLAYGIDSCAHRKAVQLGIENIAILGSGIDRIYPANHRGLADRIKKKGALVSQFQFGAKPDKENFPMRNHVVAGMSDVVVVVQSKKSGGSLITAEIANNFNKDVFAFPGKVGDLNSEGCNALIKQHKAHLIQSAKDIAYIMRWEQQEKVEAQMKLFEELDASQKEIMMALNGTEAVDIDSLHALLQISLSHLSSDLLNLEFMGLVKSLPGKRYMAM